ncbi:hypothetical protein BKA70DRAFT_1219509 [Coprinopsis sp. MPI-PUGE-AT-0042]|nr:hypothetical protein BKA70DRAFT_1219509 [Coprinopsis sp. MPI-PUGE-AT-0042]
MTTVDHHLMHPFYMVPNEIWVESPYVRDYDTSVPTVVPAITHVNGIQRLVNEILGLPTAFQLDEKIARMEAVWRPIGKTNGLAMVASQNTHSDANGVAIQSRLWVTAINAVDPPLAQAFEPLIQRWPASAFCCKGSREGYRSNGDQRRSTAWSKFPTYPRHRRVPPISKDYLIRLSGICMSVDVGNETLGLLLSNARGRRMARTMEELLIRLDSNLAIDQVLLLVGGTFTRLRILGIEQSKLRAQLTLKSLIYYAVLPKLQVLLLNISDVWPFRWHESSSDSHYPAMAPFFDTLSACREPLTYVSFGLVVYKQKGDGFREVVDTNARNEWSARYCTHRQAVHPKLRVVWR